MTLPGLPSAAHRSRAVGTLAVSLGLLGWLLVGTAARAHEPSPRGLDERQLRRLETRLLGPEHAAERRLERRGRPGVVLRSTRTRRTRAEEPTASVGSWNDPLPGHAPFGLPTYAIHAALLPTGKVILWGYPPLERYGTGANNHGDAWLWEACEREWTRARSRA